MGHSLGDAYIVIVPIGGLDRTYFRYRERQRRSWKCSIKSA